MDTYDFVTEWAAAKRPTRVLDYGCGAGQIVKRLRARGIDAVGCEVFYDGGDYSKNVPQDLWPFIRRMEGDRIPFEDKSFDLVLSNQVFEHVPDMDIALAEIARVLKPAGVAVNVFPDAGVWQEGHCLVPFAHWFRKRSKVRFYYVLAFRLLGFGSYKKGKTRIAWARHKCDWLDKWTYYRPLPYIVERFNKFIGQTHMEDEKWFSARFGGKFDFLPLPLQRFIVRKIRWAGFCLHQGLARITSRRHVVELAFGRTKCHAKKIAIRWERPTIVSAYSDWCRNCSKSICAGYFCASIGYSGHACGIKSKSLI